MSLQASLAHLSRASSSVWGLRVYGWTVAVESVEADRVDDRAGADDRADGLCIGRRTSD